MAISVIGAAAAAASENNFTVLIGSSGNNEYTLDRSYPAGSYRVTLVNGDTTFDVYAISQTGTLVGYTNNARLDASDSFRKLTILGAANNERLTFTYEGVPTVPTAVGGALVAGAYITSIGTPSLPSVNGSTTVVGGNFADNVSVSFIGTNSSETMAKSVTRTSSTLLTAVRPDDLPNDFAPYSVKVVNPGVLPPTGSNSHILTGAVTTGNDPVWVTGTTLPSGTTNTAYTTTVSATDGEGGITQYQIVGTPPPGLSLNSTTGVLSGTPTGIAIYSIVIRAFDNGNNTADRTFSLTINPPASGGTFFVTGGYVYHRFTASENLVSTKVITGAEALIVAGGGGSSANGQNGPCGGGGAGGFRYISGLTIPIGNSPVVVGAGGAGVTSGSSASGSASSILSNSSVGGGRSSFGTTAAASGGSGGGGGADGFTSVSGGAGTAGQGFAGGNGAGNGASERGGGGGGGAAGAGANGTTGGGGAGGAGNSSYSAWATATASGASGAYAGGGGGGQTGVGTIGPGGVGGGGNGANTNNTPAAVSGTVNTGGGGGGGIGFTGAVGGNGGSGIVIVRYPV